jgi:uncharacterized membrane protein YjjB (DUF3815 family)
MPRGNRVRRLLAGRIGGFAAACVANALVVALFAPPVLFLVAGGWALVSYLRSLYQMWGLFSHWQLDAVYQRLQATDLAARVGLASGSYFALLLALIVVVAGLLGRHWTRLFLLPGLLLAIPAGLLYLVGSEAANVALTGGRGWQSLAATLLIAYALFDALTLAALLADLRPRRRRRRQTSRPLPAATPAPMPQLPLVRFGPPPVALAPAPTAAEDVAVAAAAPSAPMLIPVECAQPAPVEPAAEAATETPATPVVPGIADAGPDRATA